MPHEAISVFDIFKIGVGPSSSHTLGPWRAALRFMRSIQEKFSLGEIKFLRVLLYGSLAKTGKGHGTDIAVQMGLMNEDPVTTDVNLIHSKMLQIISEKKLPLSENISIDFNPDEDIEFLISESLPYHPNALTFLASFKTGDDISETYYSIGGGFVIKEGEQTTGQTKNIELAFPINTADDLLHWCMKTGLAVNEVVLENENAWRPENETKKRCFRNMEHDHFNNG